MTTLKGISKQLTKAHDDDEYGNYEHLDNMIDAIVPEGYIVRVCCDSVDVFELIEDLALNDDDLTSLNEDGRITMDDIDIQIVRN